jgi:GT2 family glycosyltransferase
MGRSDFFFSVIVPTYERPQQLAVCLKFLAGLEYPRDQFEVIVVDDGSELPADNVVASFHDKFHVTLLSQSHSGPAAARNFGAARAKGRFLAFIDDDCAPAVDWLQKLAARFTETPDCAIGGRTLNALPDNQYSSTTQLIIDYLYAYYNSPSTQARFLTSNNLAVTAEYFHLVGGFDAGCRRAAAEDRELCDRWIRKGYRMLYAREVLVYHAHPLTFHSFLCQHFNYGRGASYFHRVRMVKMESLQFYLRLLFYLPFQVDSRQVLVMFLLIGVAQVANAAGFFWESACGNFGFSRPVKTFSSLSNVLTIFRKQQK